MDSNGSGWRLFAGILVGIGGVFNIIDGLVAISNASYVNSLIAGNAYNNGLPIVNQVSTWGWIVLIVGIVMVAATFGILSGAMWGRVVGIIVAALNMVVQFAWLVHFPFWSFTMIIVDVFVIYALAVHGRVAETETA